MLIWNIFALQVVSDTDLNQSVYIYRCEGSTVKVQCID
jgi:hypothetical protein